MFPWVRANSSGRSFPSEQFPPEQGIPIHTMRNGRAQSATIQHSILLEEREKEMGRARVVVVVCWGVLLMVTRSSGVLARSTFGCSISYNTLM